MIYLLLLSLLGTLTTQSGMDIFVTLTVLTLLVQAARKKGPEGWKLLSKMNLEAFWVFWVFVFDELPQLWNVLKGEMSFVGPRPERPYFVDMLTAQVPYYNVRHSIKPGITGWAQVRYPYGSSIEDAIEKLQYDLYYVKNHSLFLDLVILILTVEVVLLRKGSR